MFAELKENCSSESVKCIVEEKITSCVERVYQLKRDEIIPAVIVVSQTISLDD